MLEGLLHLLVRVLELALALVHLPKLLLERPDRLLVGGGGLLLLGGVKLLDGGLEPGRRAPQLAERLVQALHGALNEAEALLRSGGGLALFRQVICVASVEGLVERVADDDLVEGLEGGGGHGF